MDKFSFAYKTFGLWNGALSQIIMLWVFGNCLLISSRNRLVASVFALLKPRIWTLSPVKGAIGYKDIYLYSIWLGQSGFFLLTWSKLLFHLSLGPISFLRKNILFFQNLGFRKWALIKVRKSYKRGC